MLTYTQNSNAYLTALFVDYKGEEASISGTPSVSIYHIKNDSVVTDVNSQSLTQISGSLYYYKFYISSAKDRTTYIAKFSATYSNGINVAGETSFLVVEKDFYKQAKTGGLVQKIIGKTVWTLEEKNRLLQTISELQDRFKSLTDNNKSLVELNKDIFKDSRKSLTKIKNDLNQIQLNNKNTKIQSQIELISKELKQIQSIIPQEHIDEKINLSLKEIKTSINDITRLVIKSIPTEKIEEELNGY